MPPCASIFVPDVDVHAAPGTIQELAACAPLAAATSSNRDSVSIVQDTQNMAVE